MRPGVREMGKSVGANLPAAAGAALGILIVSWFGLIDWAWTDYDREARPAFDALVAGHVWHFLALAPSYGGSLLMRAPFVLATKLWGGGELAIFRASAFPCLMASGILAVWLVSRLRAQGATRVARGLTLVLCAANPVTVLALETGHPEELLGAVLCVGAVLAAMGDRPGWAGVLLGLAVANQPWGVLAAGPVLLALPSRGSRSLAVGAGVAGACFLPLVAAGGVVGQLHSAAQTNDLIFSPWQIWWFLGPHLHRILPAAPWATRLEPHWLSLIAHPLIAAIGIPLTLLCVRLRRRRVPRPRNEAMLLLVLLLLLRCALDPWDNWYYPLPFLIALLTWEALTLRRPPLASLIATFATWALTQWVVPAHGFSADAQSVTFLLLALPALALIVVSLYAPGLWSRVAARRQRPAAVANPA
jgi:hypothetical protein